MKGPYIQPLRDSDIGYGFCPWAKGPSWVTLESYKFIVRDGNHEHEYTIPEGYTFDKASIPPLLWSFGYTPDGLCTLAALEHDLLCDLYSGGSEWLKQALGGHLPPAPPVEVIHWHFYKRLLEDGVRPSKAKVMWLAVRSFGPGGLLRPTTILGRIERWLS